MRLFHNPRCTKSRAALDLCEQSGKRFTIIEYLKEGVDEKTIRGLIARLSSELPTLVRTAESEFDTQTDLDNADSVVRLLLSQPRCLQRPILDDGKIAIIGRPPELILTLLQAHE
jgi:arsenate reductase